MTRRRQNPARRARLSVSCTSSRAGEAAASPSRSEPIAEALRPARSCVPGRDRSGPPDRAGPVPGDRATARGAAGPLLTTADVCAVFGRTPRTIRNWVQAGHLRPVRVGRSVFFRQEDVDLLAGAEPVPAYEPEDEPWSPRLNGPS